MITDVTMALCGRQFTLTAPQIMQCLVIKSHRSICESEIGLFMAQWNSHFATVADVYNGMQAQMANLMKRYLTALDHMFWDTDTETPYDRAIIEYAIPELIQCQEVMDTLENYKNHAIAVAEAGERELAGIHNPGLGESFSGIGFGVKGVLAAGLINTGANLLDYGIQSASEKSILQKYKEKIEDIRCGKGTMLYFSKIIEKLMKRINVEVVDYISDIYGVANISVDNTEGWDSARPTYKRLSQDEKIDFCLQLLQRNPIHLKVYKELMYLTAGCEQSLIQYGNQYIEDELGNRIRKEYGEFSYKSAIQLAESRTEDVKNKLDVLGKIEKLYGVDCEADISRLKALLEEKTVIDELAFAKKEVHRILTKGTKAEILSFELFYEKEGWLVFSQELSYIQNGYTGLPSEEIIRSFAEKGNGVPLLIEAEAAVIAGHSQEPVALWTKWAKGGNPYALLRLGLCRLYGNGIACDLARSKHLLTRAMYLHYPPAAYILQKMVEGAYRPALQHFSKQEKDDMITLLRVFNQPEESYQRYLSFGKKQSGKK